MTDLNLESVITEQMLAMVAMSKEVRNQFTEIKALRAELTKAANSRDHANREIKQLSSSYTGCISQLDKVQRDNTKLRSKVDSLETLTQKQRGLSFNKLR
jgi:chromosome segregation ATPase